VLIGLLVALLVISLVNFYFSIQILRRVSAAEVKLSFFEIFAIELGLHLPEVIIDALVVCSTPNILAF